LPLLIGTIIGHEINFPNTEATIAAVLLSLAFLFFISKTTDFVSRGILSALIWLSIGALNADLSKSADFDYFLENAKIVASIAEQVNERDDFLKIKLKLLQINDTSVGKQNWYIMLNLKKDSLTPHLDYGNKLFFVGNIAQIKNRGNPYEFDYQNFLHRKRIIAQTYISNNKFVVLKGFEGSAMQKWAYNARTFLLNQYIKQKIEDQNLAVLSALTLGYKEDLSQETKQQFSGTGAMHILAVSGLHVGIVYMIIAKILQILLGRRFPFLKFTILILTIWTFAIISGSSASVLRASLMISFVALATTFQRESNIYNTIILSSFFLILFNPSIIYEVGFQLSYLAVISIVWLVPIIENWWHPNNTIIKKIWSLLAVSIAAQLGTSPIALYYFHQFPNYFFITNLAVVPLAGYILTIAIIFLSISFIPFISNIIAYLLNLSVIILRFIVESIDSLPYSSTQFIPFSFIQIFIAYALIFIVFMFIQYKYYFLLRATMITLLLFGISLIGNKLTNAFQNRLVIYNSPPNAVYQIVNGSKYSTYTQVKDSTALFYVEQMIKNYAMHAHAGIQQNKHYFTENHGNEVNVYQFGKHKILFLKDDYFNQKKSNQLFELDYIVLNEGAEIKLENLQNLFKFKSIIFDSSVSSYKRKSWLSEATDLKIPVHDVKEQGAFILEF